MNRRVLAVLVAVLLAIGGGALVVLYAKNADARAIAQAQPEPVYVAQKLVPAGTTLKDAERTQLIVKTSVAAAGLPQGALQEINADNNSLLALSDIQPGQYLLSAGFGSTPVGEKAIEVPPGKLAVSVQLSDPARVGKFVTPGTHISIFATYKIKMLDDSDRSKLINEQDIKGTHVLMEDVQVIGMGDAPLAAPSKSTDSENQNQSQNQNTQSFLVTVAVTPDQATRLIHGINNYTLYAGLRGSDVKVSPNDQVNDTDIFTTVIR